ncbi:type 2 lanthipeptide synthetase LanM family protein [Streptomyces sp. NBC_00572]|uniref:type 2 lanthipeptide synthetase LanM family protein n=1 Tax=Streptomyces sp. NBC_00572 TaxID=2903664 RepID=UPI0022595F18|nr:type 2 lanthipeptide synthetase LanM family protein [Streptomyces sp. NBC_00572]MCX4986475.1 type 2 lanthipeptide synthetase LanM family protein [Streptomyces sp. NBC_00572]
MAVKAGHERAAASLSEVERWWDSGLVRGDGCGGGHGGDGRRPDWAVLVEEAVAAAPLEAVAPSRDYPGLSGFEWALRPLTGCAGERLERRVTGRARELVDMTAVRNDLERQLSGGLARAAARTLVLELHEARSAGRLDGDDTQARFRDFLARTASRRGLSDLLAGRPVLARILGRAALDAADAVAEMLERLADDRALLVAGLLKESGGDPGLLVGIEPGAGDGHRGGRSVMLLRFADGARLVYKPRPLAVHRHFNDLVAWFNALPDSVDLRALRLLDRGEYGWVEFVAARPCAAEAEVEEFYRRQGALLALLHLLDGTDLHHENLIAVGAHPVLVDVETLFHPPLPGSGTGDPAARALHDSVYRVGLLPQLLVGDHSALDVSAVGGGREGVSPVERADFADAGTDRMRLVRRAGTFGESANRPRLASGEPIEPGAHIEALCAGFRAGYTAIGAARGELVGGAGLLKAFAEDEVRVVVRPTWVYTMLLDESTHPDLLKDADERQHVLEALRTDRFGPVLAPGLIDEEIIQLWAGDVPLFTARPGQDHLWGAPERPPADRMDLPGIARVAAKLGVLDTVDRQDQERIVRAAMATTSRTPAHRPAEGPRTRTAGRAPEPERLLSAARSVGDQLVSLAYREGPRSNWIGLELLDDRYWRIGPMAADLAGGYTGPALFLAQLAALTGAGHYAEAARTALAPMPGLLDALRARPEELGAVGSGAHSGLGGIAYALAETARLLDDPEVGAWASGALRLVAEATRVEPECGVGAGLAGGLVALVACHGAGGSEGRGAGGGAGGGEEREIRRAARACADRLVAADLTGADLTGPGPAGADLATIGRGFANGAAGIGWALLRFAEVEATAGAGVGAAERYRLAGLSAIRAAAGAVPEAARDRGEGGGHGGASAPSPGVGSAGGGARASAWCRGEAGVALAVLDAPGALDDPQLAAWARTTVERLGQNGPAPDDSLCHGEAGVCELLGHTALPEARPHWIRRAGALLASVEEHGARSGAPDGVPHPGLLTGLSGIGHGLLRAGFPERVPSLLLLRSSQGVSGPPTRTTYDR